jgi:hypothetical protein
LDPIEQQALSPEAEAEPLRTARPSLLSLLIENGVASEGELRLIAAEGMGGGVRLGEALLERGWIDEPGLGRLLARQWNLPFVEEGSVDSTGAADEALSRERAHKLRAFCSRAEDGSLQALVSDPSTDQLNGLREELGEVTFAVITDRELRRLLRETELRPDVAAAAPAAGDGIAAQLLTDLGSARERLEELHAQVANTLRAQEAVATERASLAAQVEELRHERLADQERIRDLEEQRDLERERYRQLVLQLTQLTAAHS